MKKTQARELAKDDATLSPSPGEDGAGGGGMGGGGGGATAREVTESQDSNFAGASFVNRDRVESFISFEGSASRDIPLGNLPNDLSNSRIGIGGRRSFPGLENFPQNVADDLDDEEDGILFGRRIYGSAGHGFLEIIELAGESYREVWFPITTTCSCILEPEEKAEDGEPHDGRPFAFRIKQSVTKFTYQWVDHSGCEDSYQ